MVSLRTLGAVGLTAADGRDVDGLLRQPKRLALLIYLASPEPGSWHRRETIMALFWPSFGTSQARVALRNALYVIRHELGGEVVRTRGDDEVSIDPAILESDVASLRAAIRARDDTNVLERYSGAFLPGFAAVDADGFERWLDDERRWLSMAASQAAARISIAREKDGDLAGAIAAQRWLVDLDCADESQARRLMSLLDAANDHGQALATFDRVRDRLHSEFDAEPARETIALAETIRARRHHLPATTLAPETPASPRVDTSAVVAPKSATNDVLTPARRRRWWIGGVVVAAAISSTLALWAARACHIRRGPCGDGGASDAERDRRRRQRLHRLRARGGDRPAPGGARNHEGALGGTSELAGADSGLAAADRSVVRHGSRSP